MHDKNGKPLFKGDTVTITCVVKECTSNPDHCNVTLETVEPMFPSDDYKSTIVLNTKQVEKIDQAPDAPT